MVSSRVSRQKTSDIREYICGWGAAFVNINVTYPINKVIFRQMRYGVDTQLAIRQLKKEGLKFLYRGMLPPLIQKTITVSIMFGTFSQYRQLLDSDASNTTEYRLLQTTIAAFMAGTTEALLTPFERIQMLLQDRQHHSRYNNTFDTFRQLKVYGIKEYYRGLSAILCRNGPSNILFFGLRTPVKESIKPIGAYPRTFKSDLIEDFISGACLGAVISTIFYPINVIRTKMQTSPVGGEFISMRRAFELVHAERGKSIRKLFYGVHVNYSRAFISWGIINASYEVFRKLLYGPNVNDL